jgi:hypothetical protein
MENGAIGGALDPLFEIMFSIKHQVNTTASNHQSVQI